MASRETTTKFKVDISDLKKSMQEARRQTALAASEFKTVASTLDDWSKSSDGLKAKLKQLQTNLSSQKSVLAEYEKTLEAVKKEYEAGSKEVIEWETKVNNQQAAVNKTEREIRKFSDSLTEVAEAERLAAQNGTDTATELDKMRKSAEDAGKSAEKSSDGFTVMKGALSHLVAEGIERAISALKDFSEQAINTGMDFESAMAEVGAISGANADELALLEETAKEYGATTVFSASESAEALKYMALAGWDAEKSASALGGILDLAAASGMDLASASDMVTDYMSAFGMEAEQSTYFADLLAYAQANANTSASQLGEAFKNSAANLNAAGQDVETVTSLLSMMANQGFKGSEAGTALTAIMRDITKSMENGQIAIGETNVEVMDANGNYRDLTDILKDVEAATNGMGDAERATALSASFTADSTKGLNLLLNAGVGEAEAFEEALRGAGGTASDMGATMNDTLAGDVKAAQSAFEDLMLTAYDEFQPQFREIVQYLTETTIPNVKEFITLLRDDIIPKIKAIPDELAKYEPLIAGIATAIAGIGLAVLVGNMASVIAAIKEASTVTELWTKAQQLFNIVMNANPLVLVISIVAALVVAFVTAYKTSDVFREKVDGAFLKVKETIYNVVMKVKSFFADLIKTAKELPQQMLNIGKNVVDGIWNGIVSAKDAFMNNVKGFFTGIVDGAKNALGIHSPSKIFAEEVGKWIPKGIAVGIDANADAALKSIKSLSTEMVGSARSGMGTAVAGSVVYNFNQTNNSPRALSRLEIYRQSKNLLGYAGGV